MSAAKFRFKVWLGPGRFCNDSNIKYRIFQFILVSLCSYLQGECGVA